MKLLGRQMLLAAMLCSSANAQPLKPMASGSFDGIPMDRVLGTFDELGEWEMPKQSWLKIFTVAGVFKKGCEGRNSDPDNCNQSRLYVDVKDWRPRTTADDVGLPDYFLFRGPNGIAWRLPKNETLKKLSENFYSIRLCGYQTRALSSWDEVGEYTLEIHRPAKRTSGSEFRISLQNGASSKGEECPLDAFVNPPPPIPIK